VYVVAVPEQLHLRLVAFGIAFQTLDPLFDGAAKPRTNLKTFLRAATGHHGSLLKKEPSG
jgi:hypothetical protein